MTIHRKNKFQFKYTLVRRICEITQAESLSGHGYKMCLDILDLGLGSGAKYYIAKYSTEYKDTFGQPRLVKAISFTEEELMSLAAALGSLCGAG